MRLASALPLTALLLTAFLATPALAQQVSPMTGTTNAPPALPPAGATASPATPAAPAHRARQTLQQRFETANTTHDGKLTLDQAKTAKMTQVTRHFDAIDTGKKGYVTLDDIRAHNRAQRAASKAAK